LTLDSALISDVERGEGSYTDSQSLSPSKSEEQTSAPLDSGQASPAAATLEHIDQPHVRTSWQGEVAIERHDDQLRLVSDEPMLNAVLSKLALSPEQIALVNTHAIGAQVGTIELKLGPEFMSVARNFRSTSRVMSEAKAISLVLPRIDRWMVSGADAFNHDATIQDHLSEANIPLHEYLLSTKPQFTKVGKTPIHLAGVLNAVVDAANSALQNNEALCRRLIGGAISTEEMNRASQGALWAKAVSCVVGVETGTQLSMVSTINGSSLEKTVKHGIVTTVASLSSGAEKCLATGFALQMSSAHQGESVGFAKTLLRNTRSVAYAAIGATLGSLPDNAINAFNVVPDWRLHILTGVGLKMLRTMGSGAGILHAGLTEAHATRVAIANDFSSPTGVMNANSLLTAYEKLGALPSQEALMSQRIAKLSDSVIVNAPKSASLLETPSMIMAASGLSAVLDGVTSAGKPHVLKLPGYMMNIVKTASSVAVNAATLPIGPHTQALGGAIDSMAAYGPETRYKSMVQADGQESVIDHATTRYHARFGLSVINGLQWMKESVVTDAPLPMPKLPHPHPL
jgi:hypothetical protein